ncbi:hypothetical protein [Kiloniella sp.]|uniref:hypothetical protein n=1 Tax=Kiloniella sp. TaxID=1938587 RepID=UPI003B01289D
MTLKVDVLKAASEKLFAYLEETGVTEIPLEHDYHWVMNADEALDLTKEPKLNMMGQLTDNYEAMTKLAKGEDDPFGYHLVWLATLLDYIGHRQH